MLKPNPLQFSSPVRFILDNFFSHKSASAEVITRTNGVWMLFVPPYSPDLNPIKMAFSKLKAHLCAITAGTFSDLEIAIGRTCAVLS